MMASTAYVKCSEALIVLEECDPKTRLCACPRCASADIWPELGNAEPWCLYCKACGWGGPRVDPDQDADAAISAWNREVNQINSAKDLGLAINWDQPPLFAEEMA